MSGVEVALCEVLTDRTRRDRSKLQFASSRDEKNTYYVYASEVSGSNPGIHVSRTSDDRSHTAVLHTGLNSIQLEACAPSVYILTSGWTTRPSEQAFVPLPPSNVFRQVLHILRPDEAFKIGDREFSLQPRQKSPEREVQIMSSGPDDVNGHDRADNGLLPQPCSRPGTPSPEHDNTIMETPVTDRQEPPLVAEQQVEANSRSQDVSPTPMAYPAVSNKKAYHGEQAHGEFAHNAYPNKPDSAHSLQFDEEAAHTASTNHSAFVPASVEENLEPVADRNTSSQTTASSNDGSTVLSASQDDDTGRLRSAHGRQELGVSPPSERNTRKRSGSHHHDGETSPPGNVTIVRLESAPDTGEVSVRGPPRKRQKGTVTPRALSKGADESQNSVRSTIRVEVPDLVQSLIPVAEHFVSPALEDNQLEKLSKSSQSGAEAGMTPPNPTKSTEPPSSNRSTRSGGKARKEQEDSQNEVLRVYYASSTRVEESTVYTRFLRQHNVKQVKNIADCDILCTGKGELKRTSNLILAVLMGKEVVTDQWVIQSATEKKLLDTADFVPESPARTREWGTSLSDAIDRGRHGLKPLQGWTINFTPSVKKELGKSWSELKEVCLAAGADAVQAMIPRKSPEESSPTVVIATSHEPDESTLEERGWRLFSKDIITFSVLRGGLDADSDEFLMKPTKKGGGRGRKKKA
ncbi:MAG: hypothetical protein LQ338_007396 [Usnochroma carphineum]|nr:MAG: hypothetical protein LQ338_007396 [Usnochroma carphineum]